MTDQSVTANKGFILTATHRTRGGSPEVHLYGVLDNGESFLVVDDRPRPYFFIRADDLDRARSLVQGVEFASDNSLRTFDGAAAARLTAGDPGDMQGLRRRLEHAGIKLYEADLRFATRYLIDRGIRGSLAISGEYQRCDAIARTYRNPEIVPQRWTPNLSVLSIDIETDARAQRLLSIALHCDAMARVLMIGDRALDDAENVADERALIERFLVLLREIDPDIVTGWNVIDFDLTVLARIARRCGLRLTIGRNGEEFAAQRDASFARDARAVVSGRAVLDGLALLRGAFIKLPDYRLETAAQTVLGRGKLLAGDGRAAAIEDNYRNNPQFFVDYNLEDARLVSQILEQTGLVQLAVERSLLTGMPLDRVGAAIASIDSLYLPALRQRGMVAPSVGAIDRRARIGGGFVMDSKPGLYENILVYDFRSLYPSIIRTFNLDPLCLIRPGEAIGDAITAPNGAHFRRQPPGILPELVTQLAAERAAARQCGAAVQANAIKILMNSMYGVLGAGACRLFSPETANAITGFGQLLVQEAADAARRAGLDVLYGDTDSVFIDSHEADPARALALAERARHAIGDAVGDRIAREWNCASHLELEFEKMYRRFFLPEVRGGVIGSKKRYAGLLVGSDGSERIEFVGLEAVRRDWSEVAKRFQRELLDRVFHYQPVEGFIRAFLADLFAGRFDADLIYRKALRKSLQAYTKTTPPHVQAARKAQQSSGAIVRYVMTRNGPELCGEESAPPDYDHYVEHQIKPVADAILRFLGTDFATAADQRRQLRLF